jgi:RHS repeat-associated protein
VHGQGIPDLTEGNLNLNYGGADGGLPSGGPALVHRYKGQYGYVTDTESNLIYCQNRFYDPYSARWITRDPSGLDGGINTYQYCLGDPIDNIDPTGLSPVIKVLEFIGESGRYTLRILSKGQAISRRLQGRNIIVQGKGASALASEIENAVASVGGREVLYHHEFSHAQPSKIAPPHFQSEGLNGHTFIDTKGLIARFLPIIGDSKFIKDSLTDFANWITPRANKKVTDYYNRQAGLDPDDFDYLEPKTYKKN